MDNRFSTFSPNEERFKFKASGVFYCDYNFGNVYKAVISLAAGMFAVGGYFIGMRIASETGGSIAQGGANGLMTSIGYMAVLAVIIAAWAFGLATINAGLEYSYVADEEKMTIKFPRDCKPPLVIKYTDKVGIFYKERIMFGKVQGYDVKIVCDKGEFTFNCKHTYATRSQGRKALPFYILEERMGTVEKPDFYVR